MHSGLFFGYIGLVSNIIEVMSQELKGDVKVISTGGYSTLIGGEIGVISHNDPFLVLEGLRLLYEKNTE